MAVPVPSISCCVLNHHNIFYQTQNALAFNWDMCYHLALCLRLLPFHWSMLVWSSQSSSKFACRLNVSRSNGFWSNDTKVNCRAEIRSTYYLVNNRLVEQVSLYAVHFNQMSVGQMLFDQMTWYHIFRQNLIVQQTFDQHINWSKSDQSNSSLFVLCVGRPNVFRPNDMVPHLSSKLNRPTYIGPTHWLVKIRSVQLISFRTLCQSAKCFSTKWHGTPYFVKTQLANILLTNTLFAQNQISLTHLFSYFVSVDQMFFDEMTWNQFPKRPIKSSEEFLYLDLIGFDFLPPFLIFFHTFASNVPGLECKTFYASNLRIFVIS
jgi:hypothetical protein